jgi:histidine phosphotransferase ChpT
MLSITTSGIPASEADPAPDLGALIGSRICHDLISPLGAIGNGVELIALSGQVPSPEMSLIAESVENANARIRFFRVAFGAATSEQSLGAQEIAAIVEALGQTGRHRMEWTAGGATRLEIKLAFLIILCVGSAMPWGGGIAVRRIGDGWQISGRAERMKVEPVTWAALCDPRLPLAVTSAEVEFPLARHAAARLGCDLFVDIGEGAIAVNF